VGRSLTDGHKAGRLLKWVESDGRALSDRVMNRAWRGSGRANRCGANRIRRARGAPVSVWVQRVARRALARPLLGQESLTGQFFKKCGGEYDLGGSQIRVQVLRGAVRW